MDRDREPCRRGSRDVRAQLKRIDCEDPAVVRAFVGFLEGRRLRAERPVAEKLHVTDLQPLIAITGAYSAFDGRVEVELADVPDLRRRSGRRDR